MAGDGRRSQSARWAADRGAAGAVALILAAVGCQPSERVDPTLIQQFAWAGCGEVLVGPVCELQPKSQVTLWLEAPLTATLRVLADGRPVETTWTPVEGGLRTTLPPLFGAKMLTVQVRASGAVASRILALAARPRPPALIAVDQQLTKSATTAAKMLDRVVVTDDRMRSEVETLRGRIAFRVSDSVDTAVDLWRRAAEQARAAGVLSKPFRDYSSIAFVAIRAKADPKLARQVLDSMNALPPTDFGELLTDYCEATFVHVTGDVRDSDRLLSSMAVRSRRLGRSYLMMAGAVVHANLLSNAGQHQAALNLFDRLDISDGIEPCYLAPLRAAQAWAVLLARDVGIDPPIEPVPLATEALSLYRECGDTFQVPNVFSMLALAHIQRGDTVGARKFVAKARQSAGDRSRLALDVDVWLTDVSAQAALMEGRFDDALSEYGNLDRIGQRRDLPAIRWRAATGQAQTHTQAGRHKAAIAAYRRAEEHLNAQAKQALFPSPLAVSTYRQRRAAQRFALRLMNDGRAAAAVDVLYRQTRREHLGIARAVRLQSLPPERRRLWNRAALKHAHLRARADELDAAQWRQTPGERIPTGQRLRETQMAAREALDDAFAALGTPTLLSDNLPPPADDEVIIGFDQLEENWIGYAVDRKRVITAPVDPYDSAGLLRPFAQQIRSARQVRVMAKGNLAEVDFHALPFEGAPLIVDRRVVYSLQAPRVDSAKGPLAALVVADTDGTLPRARDEGREVAARLQAWGYETATLVGPSVLRRDLLRSLAVRRLHWAGHSKEVDVSADGLGIAVLPLSETAYLTAGDVLALPTVPQEVVLAGCETGPVHANHLGVAQAFVLAGAAAVVATSRPVRDADAQRIGQALYKDRAVSLPEALRRAQVAFRDEIEDWSAFRVIVP